MIPSKQLDLGDIYKEVIYIVKQIFKPTLYVVITIISIIAFIQFYILHESGSSIGRMFERFGAEHIINPLPIDTSALTSYLIEAKKSSYGNDKEIDSPHVNEDTKTDAENTDSIIRSLREDLAKYDDLLVPRTDYLTLLPRFIGGLIVLLLYVYLGLFLIDNSIRSFERNTLNIRESISSINAVFLRSIGILFIYILIAFLVLFVLMTVSQSFKLSRGSSFHPLILVVLFAIMSISLISFMLTLVVITAESLSISASLVRVARLLKKNVFRAAGISIVFLITISIPVNILTEIFSSEQMNLQFLSYVMTGLSPGSLDWTSREMSRLVLSGMLSIITGIGTATLLPAFFTTIYYDLRTRLEGPLEYLENEQEPLMSNSTDNLQ